MNSIYVIPNDKYITAMIQYYNENVAFDSYAELLHVIATTLYNDFENGTLPDDLHVYVDMDSKNIIFGQIEDADILDLLMQWKDNVCL